MSKLQALGASTPLDSLPQVGDILCGIFEGKKPSVRVWVCVCVRACVHVCV